MKGSWEGEMDDVTPVHAVCHVSAVWSTAVLLRDQTNEALMTITHHSMLKNALTQTKNRLGYPTHMGRGGSPADLFKFQK